MKLNVLSDLHIEFFKKHEELQIVDKCSPADVCVLAGDIGLVQRSKKLKLFLAKIKEKHTHVLYLMGNHEAYNYDLLEATKELKEMSKEVGVTFMDNDLVEIDGVKFWGGTGWFIDLPGNRLYKDLMSDFRCITNLEPEIYNKNWQFKEGIYKYQPDVVISHHLPSYKSVAPQFMGYPTNRFFVNNVEEALEHNDVKLYVHGHTHVPCDYLHKTTRVVCNPLGYNFENSLASYKPLELEI